MMAIVVMNANKHGMMNRKEYNKLYYQRPDVIEKKKIKEFVTTDRRYSNPQFNINAEILD